MTRITKTMTIGYTNLRFKYMYSLRGWHIGITSSLNEPDMDTTEYSIDDEVVIRDRQFGFAVGFLCFMFEIKTWRDRYQKEKDKRGIRS